MTKRTLGALALGLALAMPAAAQDAEQGTPPDAAQTQAETSERILAIVNGEEITEGDVELARIALGPAVQRMPSAQRDELVLSLLIDMHLMAQAAEATGIAENELFQRRLAFQRMQALQEAHMNKVVAEAVTEEALRARYDEEMARRPTEELAASHILVDDEETARALLNELSGGADFAELARENSKDPGSAQRGGSLGFLRRGQTVPPFEEALYELEVGETTENPVQSRFGYHIIRLDERRELPQPPIERVAGDIRQLLVRDAYVRETERLKQEASIETPSGLPTPGVEPSGDVPTPSEPAAAAVPTPPAPASDDVPTPPASADDEVPAPASAN